MTINEAIKVMAGWALARAAEKAAEDDWELYEEVGENDWERIAYELRGLAPYPGKVDMARALDVLRERATAE